jgi:hypothetical protein
VKKKRWRKEARQEGAESGSGAARKVAVPDIASQVYAIGVLHAALRYWEIIAWPGVGDEDAQREDQPACGCFRGYWISHF